MYNLSILHQNYRPRHQIGRPCIDFPSKYPLYQIGVDWSSDCTMQYCSELDACMATDPLGIKWRIMCTPVKTDPGSIRWSNNDRESSSLNDPDWVGTCYGRPIWDCTARIHGARMEESRTRGACCQLKMEFLYCIKRAKLAIPACAHCYWIIKGPIELECVFFIWKIVCCLYSWDNQI
jgi:hypothetical protein